MRTILISLILAGIAYGDAVNNISGIDSGGERTAVGGYLNHSSFGSPFATSQSSVGSNVNRSGLIEVLYPGEGINLEKGLVAYYPFNGNANDESGNGNDGTVNGASLVTDRNGNSANAYSFENGQGYIQAGLPDSVIGTVPFTVSMWIKLDSNQNYAWILSMGEGQTNDAFHLSINDSSATSGLGFGYWNWLQTGNGIESGYTIPIGTWKQITTTRIGQTIKTYIDGEQVGDDLDVSAAAKISPGGSLTIGAIQTNKSMNYDGLIDDIRIYNRALSENEITALHNTEKISNTSLGSTEYAANPLGVNNSFEVSAPVGLSWTAESDDPWITITSGAEGVGSAIVSYTVDANAGDSQRSGQIVIKYEETLVTETSSFEIINSRYNWNGAKADAEARGGRLAVLDSQEKIDQLNSYLESQSPGVEMWIGLTDIGTNQWTWINGKPLGSDFWYEGEPNNIAAEKYVEVNASTHPGPYSWNNVGPGRWIFYILENVNVDTQKVVISKGHNVTQDRIPTYDLAVTDITNGAVNGNAGTYDNGTTATLTAVPELGYVFTGWSGDASGTDNPLGIVMGADKTIGATFTKDEADTDGDGFSNYDELVIHQSDPADSGDYPTRTLSAVAGGRGTVAFVSLHQLGATATVTAVPDLGYLFSAWTGADTGTDNPLTLTMDANKTIGATFVKDEADTDGDGFSNYDELIVHETDPADLNSYPTHTITIIGDFVGKGAIEGDEQIYKKGTTATLTATPLEAYVFNGWSGAVQSQDHSVIILMDSDKEIGVAFSEDERDPDGDGLSNYAELKVHFTDPNAADSDGDGYNDGVEVAANLDPNDSAIFPNEAPDIFEQTFAVQENSLKDRIIRAIVATDPNKDDLSFSITSGTDPNGNGTQAFRIAGNQLLVNDSGDLDYEEQSALQITITVSDGELTDEAKITVNLTDDRNEDADGDGLTQAQEEDIYGTSDTNVDTDGDGFADGAEVAAQVDPNDPLSFPNRPPVFEDEVIEVLENSVVATQVIRFKATDDEGDVINFNIITNADPDGDGNDAFIMEEDRLLVNDPGDFDHENASEFDIVIEATDGKSPENANFTIQVKDDREEDADGDGLTEAQEEDDHGTSDTNPDTDGDTYTDGEEVTFNSNPLFAQSIPYVTLSVTGQGGGTVSGSGSFPLRTVVTITATPDKDYAFNGWVGDVSSDDNPFGVLMDDNKVVRTRFVDSMDDDDDDGLSNLSERITHRTDPKDPDTDDDGLSDGVEVNEKGTNPKNPDTDGDGLTDNVETGTLTYVSRDDTGTNPNDPDTDGDGLSDGCEVKGFTAYSIVEGSFKWEAAVDDAEERGGHLATFADREEWKAALKALGNKPFAGFSYAWIGAEKKDNSWEWVTGEVFDYNLWAAGADLNRTKAVLVGDGARGGIPGTWITRSPTTNATGYFLEVTESPDPTNPDTDGDGILDGDEGGGPSVRLLLILSLVTRTRTAGRMRLRSCSEALLMTLRVYLPLN